MNKTLSISDRSRDGNSDLGLIIKAGIVTHYNLRFFRWGTQVDNGGRL